MESERRKIGKVLVFAVLFATLAFVSVGCVSGTTHYVNPSESIQAAVNAADPNDTIIVRDGTYTENVDVNVAHLTIQSENGSAYCAVKAKDPKHPVFYVGGSYVNISGFTVTGTTYYTGMGGIHIRYDAIYKADHCNISNNNCFNNNNGISIQSHNNIIFNNNCSNNEYAGIEFNGYAAGFKGSNSIYNNTCCENQQHGICIYNLINSDIYGNNCSNNTGYGVILGDSKNNHLYNNNCLNNFFCILVEDSINNTFYVNNFKNDIISRNSKNACNSTSKITYTYNGTTYENYLGNYWDDYTDVDSDSDGIWDNPYSIDLDNDNYPLVEPFENYFMPTENIFDTGQPQNPYPSIFGTHNGTIKPNQTITVSKLYTYPCVGTGGHTEYMKIYNSSDWNVTAKWEGYSGDWHNISFDNYFTLEEGETYNYTIHTGSYPQIHHIDNLSTPAGFITCSKFIDANGKRYNDWIPAIRLE